MCQQESAFSFKKKYQYCVRYFCKAQLITTNDYNPQPSKNTKLPHFKLEHISYNIEIQAQLYN